VVVEEEVESSASEGAVWWLVEVSSVSSGVS
jgi:hypothetical protein